MAIPNTFTTPVNHPYYENKPFGPIVGPLQNHSDSEGFEVLSRWRRPSVNLGTDQNDSYVQALQIDTEPACILLYGIHSLNSLPVGSLMASPLYFDKVNRMPGGPHATWTYGTSDFIWCTDMGRDPHIIPAQGEIQPWGVNINLRPLALENALQDLNRIPREAPEDGHLEPAKVTVENAKHLLSRMYEISPRRYEVYLLPDGDIAIDGAGMNGKRVVVLCEAGGGVLCLASPRNPNLSTSHPSAHNVPDDFLHEALATLDFP